MLFLFKKRNPEKTAPKFFLKKRNPMKIGAKFFFKKRNNPETIAAKVQYHLLQAECCSSKNQDNAINHYYSALNYLKLSKQRDSLDVAFIHTEIVIILREQQEWHSVIYHLMEAKKIFQKHGRNLDAASCCDSIGAIHHSNGDVESASQYYGQMVAFEEHQIPNTLSIATSYVAVGEMFLEQGDYFNAMFEFRRALDIQERDAPLSSDTATTYANIARLHRNLGNRRTAQKYRNRVIQIEVAETLFR